MKVEIKTIDEKEQFEQYTQQLDISPTLAKLLWLRNIKDYDSAKSFFRATLSDLHNPFLMQDMKKAVDLVVNAIKQKHSILIYGDYDVDGTTGIAILYDFLIRQNASVSYYIPHRIEEGYGVGKKGIDYAYQNNIDLFITVDCGISAFEHINQLIKKNIKVIICDHHKPPEKLPLAQAVLNPKQKKCQYPYKELSGAGVAFKLVQALSHHLSFPKSVFHKYLDMVALSIAADITPITGENRILCKNGFELINKTYFTGLKSLFQIAKVPLENLKTNTVVFKIAPLINAMGRLEHANDVITLFSSTDLNETNSIVKKMISINNKRRQLCQKTFNQVEKEFLDHREKFQEDKFVFFREEWHLGVLGIVASQMAEKYMFPFLLLTKRENIIKGSGRSSPYINIFECIQASEKYLINYGGHDKAIGVTLDSQNLTPFIELFRKNIKKHIRQVEYYLHVDSEIDLMTIDRNFWKILRQFEPYGPENMKPIFIAKDVPFSPHSVRTMGKNHLQITLKRDDNIFIRAVGFGMGDLYEKIIQKSTKTLTVIFQLEENSWNNKKTIEINLKKIVDV